MQADYLFVGDINSFPCVSAKKNALRGKMECLEENRILVVIPEIEGWYLAGLDGETSKGIGLKLRLRTDTVTKEMLEKLRPKRFDSRRDFNAGAVETLQDRGSESQE